MDEAFESKVLKFEEVDIPCVSNPHTLLSVDDTINSIFQDVLVVWKLHNIKISRSTVLAELAICISFELASYWIDGHFHWLLPSTLALIGNIIFEKWLQGFVSFGNLGNITCSLPSVLLLMLHTRNNTCNKFVIFPSIASLWIPCKTCLLYCANIYILILCILSYMYMYVD